MTGRDHYGDIRLYERIPIEVPGEIFLEGGAAGNTCTVVNLSGCGACIRTPRIFATYTPIVLYVEGFDRFDCLVVPRDGGLVGASFILGPERLKAYLGTLANFRSGGKLELSRLRRHPRTPASGFGYFAQKNGQRVRCQILDISPHGASLETKLKPCVGETISFGRSRGRVVRHHPKGIGVFFLHAEGARPG